MDVLPDFYDWASDWIDVTFEKIRKINSSIKMQLIYTDNGNRLDHNDEKSR